MTVDDITFTPIARADLPLIGAWLAEPHVARWWADEHTPQAIERDYGPVVDGVDPWAEIFIVHGSSGPFGLIQRYPLSTDPDGMRALAAILPVSADDRSIDYLIGRPDHVGRGVGTAMIRAFTDLLWADHPDAARIVVPVHARNIASRRVLEKAGYRVVGTGELEPDNPADSRDHVVLGIERP